MVNHDRVDVARTARRPDRLTVRQNVRFSHRSINAALTTSACDGECAARYRRCNERQSCPERPSPRTQPRRRLLRTPRDSRGANYRMRSARPRRARGLPELPALGPAAKMESKALLAGARQGHYRGLRAALMRGSPNDPTVGSLRQVAMKLGLDWLRLQRDVNSPAVAKELRANQRLAADLAFKVRRRSSSEPK